MEKAKTKKETAKKMSDVNFTVNEDLNKYRGPEFEPPKLKGIKEKFGKPVIIRR